MTMVVFDQSLLLTAPLADGVVVAGVAHVIVVLLCVAGGHYVIVVTLLCHRSDVLQLMPLQSPPDVVTQGAVVVDVVLLHNVQVVDWSLSVEAEEPVDAGQVGVHAGGDEGVDAGAASLEPSPVTTLLMVDSAPELYHVLVTVHHHGEEGPIEDDYPRQFSGFKLRENFQDLNCAIISAGYLYCTLCGQG